MFSEILSAYNLEILDVKIIVKLKLKMNYGRAWADLLHEVLEETSGGFRGTGEAMTLPVIWKI